MDSVADKISEAAFVLLLGVTFLAYQMRWRESRFFFALGGVMAIGAFGRLLILFGPEPKIPIFLALYILMAIVSVGWGLKELRDERKKHINRFGPQADDPRIGDRS